MKIIYENKQYWIEKHEDLEKGFWVCWGEDQWSLAATFETEEEAIKYIEDKLLEEYKEERKW